MTVTLYNCTSANSVLNKSYTIVQSGISATAKGAVNVDSPSLLLDYDSLNFNYFYVSDFHRFYNVTSRNLLPGKHILLTGESDPLESFGAGILNLECFIVRNEDPAERQKYIADPAIPIPSDPQYEVIKGTQIIGSGNGMYVIGVV